MPVALVASFPWPDRSFHVEMAVPSAGLEQEPPEYVIQSALSHTAMPDSVIGEVPPPLLCPPGPIASAPPLLMSGPVTLPPLMVWAMVMAQMTTNARTIKETRFMLFF